MSRNPVELINSPDPEVRRKAIIALGKSGDTRALPLLKQVFETDSEPELRELARKAALYIRQQGGASAPTPEPPAAQTPAFTDDPNVYTGYETYGSDSVYETYDPNAAYTDTGGASEDDYRGTSYLAPDASSSSGKVVEDVYVSEKNEKRAKSHFEHAIGLNMKGENAKAAKEMGRALDLNPNLANDGTFSNLASQVLGLPPSDAVRALLDEDARRQYTRKQRSSTKSGGSTATWGDVALDLGILFVVSVLIGVAYVLVLVPMMSTSFASAGAEFDLAAVGVAGGLIGGLVMGAYSVISLLISDGAIHFAAVMFGGAARLTETYHALIPIQTWLTVGGVVFAMGSLYITSTSMTGAMMSGSGASGMFALQCVVSIASIALSIGGTWWQVRRLAQVHEFGTGAGCLALIIGPLLLGILTVILFSLLGAVLGVTLDALMPSMLVLF